MKIYVVTQGCYSDYIIKKVFIDEQKANEYAEWLPDSNGVEEYDTSDDVVLEKYYEISIDLVVKPNGDEVLRTYITRREGGSIPRTVIYCNTNNIKVCLYRYIPAQKFNEEFHTKKYTKVAYDTLYIVKQKLKEGLSTEEINKLLKG